MGRQIQFHAVDTDLRMFLDFVHERDPVIVTLRDSDSCEVLPVDNPSSESQVLTLWNQAITDSLARKRIVIPGRSYYSFDSALPILELSPSRFCEWNGREALLVGRLYAAFEKSNRGYEKWYESLSRWIRGHFMKTSLPISAYIGRGAFDWYKRGGVLLPMMIPPAVTRSWLSWVGAQDQHRAMFTN